MIIGKRGTYRQSDELQVDGNGDRQGQLVSY